MLRLLVRIVRQPLVLRARHHPWRRLPVRCFRLGEERIVAVGSGPGLDFLLRSLGCEVASDELPGCRLGAVARRLAAELETGAVVVARLPWPAVTVKIERTSLVLPELVDASIPTSRHGTRPPGKSARETARRIRQNGLVWRWREDPAAFDHFYDRLYRPYVEEQHGASAVLKPRWRLRLDFHHGGIIEVRAGDDILAMNLVTFGPSSLHSIAIGATGEEARRRGALGACNLALLDLATERGLAEACLGGCLPALTDPILRNKQDWGGVLRLRPQADHLLVVAWQRPSPAISALVDRLRPIAVVNGRLIGIGPAGAMPQEFRVAGLADWQAVPADGLASSARLTATIRRGFNPC